MTLSIENFDKIKDAIWFDIKIFPTTVYPSSGVTLNSSEMNTALLLFFFIENHISFIIKIYPTSNEMITLNTAYPITTVS